MMIIWKLIVFVLSCIGLATIFFIAAVFMANRGNWDYWLKWGSM